jgi:hypothetical protein
MKAPIGDAVPLVLMVGDSRSPDGLTMGCGRLFIRSLVKRPDARSAQRCLWTRDMKIHGAE